MLFAGQDHIAIDDVTQEIKDINRSSHYAQVDLLLLHQSAALFPTLS
jgi:hypothetical protein